MRSTLHHDQRGAVLAEFVIALVPMLMTFFGFVQVGKIATARLVVKHSTIVGARAAAVITDTSEVRAGVEAAMGPWRTTMDGLAVEVNDRSSCGDPYGAVTVKVTARYRCNVPLGKLICASGGGAHPIEHTFTMPAQRARYAGALAHCGS